MKRVINIYLNEFQLKDRDLERFIEWFETNDGSRRSLGWLLERHHNGWDEDSANVDGSGNVDNNTGDRRSETAKRKHHDSETPAKKDGKPPGMNWHLQENQITDEGVKLLIAFAKRIDSKVELRRFYLYKNIIGTANEDSFKNNPVLFPKLLNSVIHHQRLMDEQVTRERRPSHPSLRRAATSCTRST